MPLVGLLEISGYTAVASDGYYDRRGEGHFHRIIAPSLMAVFAVMVFVTARHLLPIRPSLFIAFATAFGTSVWSTDSRAVWSHTWLALLTGSVLLILVRRAVRGGDPNPWLLGSLLAWMYLVRPTGALTILAVMVYLLIAHRRAVVQCALTGAAWAGLFAAASVAFYGNPMPPYYHRGSAVGLFGEALAGHLISPSRGLLIYTPIIALLPVLVWRYRAHLQHVGLIWSGAAVVVAHLLAVSLFTKGHPWWGGHCYGPRLTADLIPWFALIGVLCLRAMRASGGSTWMRRIAIGLIVVGAVLHGRGAISRETNEWSALVDTNPALLWDWSSPQMLYGLIDPPEAARD
jgi:hypothetical protein